LIGWNLKRFRLSPTGQQRQVSSGYHGIPNASDLPWRYDNYFREAFNRFVQMAKVINLILLLNIYYL